MTREEARLKALEYYEKAHIYLKEEEKKNLEVADMGIGDLETYGIVIHKYVDTKRCSAKEMVLFPYQICPEQRHPPFGDYPGKEESFRVREGELYVYTEGEPIDKEKMKAKIPKGKEGTFTVFHEIILKKGDQYTMQPNITHWIVGGPEGCVVSEFATYNRDDLDIYTDPAVARMHNV
ncbi:MAG: D-lyxose/D-mannose family sugar isomerase [Christensenella sp.]|nr:D-lyxose/D-mannose family sugar isomerase [Christensenella sp.]